MYSNKTNPKERVDAEGFELTSGRSPRRTSASILLRHLLNPHPFGKTSGSDAKTLLAELTNFLIKHFLGILVEFSFPLLGFIFNPRRRIKGFASSRPVARNARCDASLVLRMHALIPARIASRQNRKAQVRDPQIFTRLGKARRGAEPRRILRPRASPWVQSQPTGRCTRKKRG